ncbi:MAG TPA: heavy metal response regulator transcription factor [Gammaproteobacteria bacterium]|jgi:two-component system copper resistance phosphate regulon response regulator CusR|nr:heavy metal response regulator transcription factor [Gammaproteobacteria bacterium]
MRILVIEDDKKTLTYLYKGLTGNGYVVDIADDGLKAQDYVVQCQYDLIILDVMLPKCDGWSFLAWFRPIYPETRVLFLTARDNVEDKVKGLELGADDYLVKPFVFSELLARVRSLLRRKTSAALMDQLSLADLQVDVIKHKVSRNGVNITLTPKEFALLVFLLQHTGEVLTRALIAEKVWDINFDSDTNVIDVVIRRLRLKIDDPFEEKLLHTIRGIGYVIEQK